MKTKRIVALLISAVMVLSMIPVVTLGTAAADIEGDWTTYRFASQYPSPDDATPTRRKYSSLHPAMSTPRRAFR